MKTERLLLENRKVGNGIYKKTQKGKDFLRIIKLVEKSLIIGIKEKRTVTDKIFKLNAKFIEKYNESAFSIYELLKQKEQELIKKEELKK